MRIVMMGSGGVGGFFGGRMAHAGADVVFVARGAHLQAMREDGLRLTAPGGENLHIAKVKVVGRSADAGYADVVIVSVKLPDMATAIEDIRPLVKPGTAVLSLQNGVLKDDILRAHFAAADIVGGVAYVAARIAAPGVIEQTGALGRVVIGEYDGQRSARVTALVDWLQRGGIDASISPDIRRTLWEKYTFLVGLSGTTATMRMPIGPIRSNPQTRAFLLDVMKEAVAVGRALGVDLPTDYAEQRLAFADSVSPDMTSSMHHDLERGARLEVEWLSGGVVKLGQQVGVATPLNRAIRDVLALHAAGATER